MLLEAKRVRKHEFLLKSEKKNAPIAGLRVTSKCKYSININGRHVTRNGLAMQLFYIGTPKQMIPVSLKRLIAFNWLT